MSKTISLFRRGHVQAHVGRDARDMTRWYFNVGPERIGRELHFSGSVHVPGCAVSFSWVVSRA